jgi:hypothetical protein
VAGKFPEYRVDIDLVRRLELEFIKFQDRPLWLKVALFIVSSPAVLFYCAKKVAKKCYRLVIRPIIRATDRFLYRMRRKAEKIAYAVFVTFPLKIYQKILTPIGHGLLRGAKFTYSKVLTPIGRVVDAIVRTVIDLFYD